jgi:hypothetical protein
VTNMAKIPFGEPSADRLRHHWLDPQEAAAGDRAERKLRCFKPDRHRNPCPNEAISDWGLCLTHLQEAHAEYEALLSEALGRHPAGRRR